MTSKLQNTKKASKSYWPLLKIFLNNQKIPLIPPLFDSNRFASDLKHKPEPFSDFFSNQRLIINNNSKLLTNLNHDTGRRLFSVTFSADDVAKVIQNVNSNKAHGHDNISIRMLKICDDTIRKP